MKSDSILTTVGINPGEDFPVRSYESIIDLVNKRQSANPYACKLHGSSWNALAYRFKACAEHDAAFTESFSKHGPAPPPQERYIQERELFGFFVNGQSVLEAFCFGLFTIGALIKPDSFDISSEKKLRRINVEETTRTFSEAFMGEPLTDALNSLITSPKWSEWKNWKEIRDILIHRLLPNRTICAIGSSIEKSKWGKNPLDGNFTLDWREWLSVTLQDLMDKAASFCDAYLDEGDA